MAPKKFGVIALVLAVIGGAYGHGAHQDLPATGDWATDHMRQEHHIDSFDAGSFFALHDYDDSGTWTADEIMKTYGLYDSSNSRLTDQQRSDVVHRVLAIFDPSNTGTVTRDDFLREISRGNMLPDFGYGPGHHGDMEYEYEIHHYEKYHDENTKDEDLIHPEDIEHFRLHDEQEAAEVRLEQLDRMRVVEANIPLKFRRQ